MNGPALIAGSTFVFKKIIGVVDPIMAAKLTASMIPVPRTMPSIGADFKYSSAICFKLIHFNI